MPPEGLDYQEREEDPYWHLGHACFDLSRVLIQPYGRKDDLSSRYGMIFFGPNAHKPWEEQPPGWEELANWWEEVLDKIEGRLPSYEDKPQFIVTLDELKVETAGQAWDYALFHTGFHLGRIHQLIGW